VVERAGAPAGGDDSERASLPALQLTEEDSSMVATDGHAPKRLSRCAGSISIYTLQRI
jgi:hypothetical protein